MGDAVFTGALGENRTSHHQPKLDFKGADPASRNSLVSTPQADKKKICMDKTSSSLEFSAT
jgi:hypothetical protein